MDTIRLALNLPVGGLAQDYQQAITQAMYSPENSSYQAQMALSGLLAQIQLPRSGGGFNDSGAKTTLVFGKL